MWTGRSRVLVRIPPAEAIRALLEGADTEITVRGKGVHIELEFMENRALSKAANQRKKHCPR